MGVVKNGHGLLVHETLKSAYLKNELINWADFLNADWYNNFWLDWYPNFWFLNAGVPVQLYFLFQLC